MPLCLHAGAREVSFADLCDIPTPEPTNSHLPIPHHEIVTGLRFTLGFYGHEIVEEGHAVMPDGARYFGLMTLRSSWGELYTDVVGLRNSHDKAFPIGIAFGSRVFVCDNMAFMGDRVIRRKHTAKSRGDLPGLLSEIVQSLQLVRVAQNQRLLAYQGCELSAEQADHAILEIYRHNVINIQRVPDLIAEWEAPRFDWGKPTAWRLFNAATLILADKVMERPRLTAELHTVMDGVCAQVRH